jgi:hypothetical protein
MIQLKSFPNLSLSGSLGAPSDNTDLLHALESLGDKVVLVPSSLPRPKNPDFSSKTRMEEKSDRILSGEL